MKNILILIVFIASNGLALSIDRKIDLNKKIVTFSSFEEAKNKGVIDGKFYGNGKESFFENLKLTEEFAHLDNNCMIKGSVVGYQNAEAPLFINSLPALTASKFNEALFSLNYMYAMSISLVIEFSKECKKNKDFPDSIVIRQH